MTAAPFVSLTMASERYFSTRNADGSARFIADVIGGCPKSQQNRDFRAFPGLVSYSSHGTDRLHNFTPTVLLVVIQAVIIGATLSTGVQTASAATLTCSAATTLDTLATCIRGQMPGSGSNGFVAPTTSQQNDWRLVVNQMLSGSCNFALPASLASIMQLRTFTDTVSGKSFCLLMEVLDANNNGIVDRGWGTFIVNPAAVREISHQAPHPISDSTTENQAIGIFGGTDSRSYLMAGAHRSANSGASACQNSYGPADVAHNVANMFHATNAELMAFYATAPWQAIQWHGMAADTCSAAQAYLSHGRAVSPAPGDKNLELKNAMLGYHPAWDLEVPGTGACTLNATDNTQGRLLNGIPAASVCGTAATSYTGQFLHIEQDPGFRLPADWIPAVNDTWPTGIPEPPPPPAGLGATAGNAQVSLVWTASPGANSYRLYRSTVAGGLYTQIASDLAGTSHTDTGVTNGTTYYYVTTAVNASGESAYSGEVSATPMAPTAPPAPTGLTAVSGKKKVTLSWNPVAGATSYTVKRSVTTGGPYSIVASGVTATTFANSGLKTGVTYYFVVAAVNAAGEGPHSNQASATPR